jgi:pimeloyl-ACP methyl ester carboxylesterase
MTAFALVHGGWHGGWCWELVQAELAARGHTSVAPDLPITDPAAGAVAYADAVLAALPAALPAEDVVLVTHSLAGLVAPLVAAAAPVRQVVYLAAMLPEPGRSVDDRARAGQRMTRRGIGRGQTVDEDGSTSFLPAAAVELFYPDSPPERAALAATRLRPQHWRVTSERSPVTARTATPETYVLCTEDRIIDTDWARATVPGRAELVELPGDHCPFLARPTELADLLEALTRPRPG